MCENNVNRNRHDWHFVLKNYFIFISSPQQFNLINFKTLSRKTLLHCTFNTCFNANHLKKTEHFKRWADRHWITSAAGQLLILSDEKYALHFFNAFTAQNLSFQISMFIKPNWKVKFCTTNALKKCNACSSSDNISSCPAADVIQRWSAQRLKCSEKKPFEREQQVFILKK